jgi:RES domain-containing protein
MSLRKRPRQKFYFPREVLLVEIERRCQFPECEARNLVSLTKSEAIEYRGFDCDKCQRWNDDTVRPEALPESWAQELLMNQDDLSAH